MYDLFMTATLRVENVMGRVTALVLKGLNDSGLQR